MISIAKNSGPPRDHDRIRETELRGVVTKKRSGHYLPGRRGWIKTKNREYWRYPLEVAAAQNRR
jgi:ATP-dependent DNA ligase